MRDVRYLIEPDWLVGRRPSMMLNTDVRCRLPASLQRLGVANPPQALANRCLHPQLHIPAPASLQRLEIAGMLINAFRAVIATTPEDLLPMVRPTGFFWHVGTCCAIMRLPMVTRLVLQKGVWTA